MLAHMRHSQIEAVAIAESMAVFVTHLLQGEEPADAARLAGYPEPSITAKALIRHPQVRKALAEGASAMIECELVPLSLKVAREILLDTEPKAVAVRAKLAVAMLDRAAKNRETLDDPAQALAKMTGEELAQFVAKGMAAQAQEAQTIDVTPQSVRNA